MNDTEDSMQPGDVRCARVECGRIIRAGNAAVHRVNPPGTFCSDGCSVLAALGEPTVATFCRPKQMRFLWWSWTQPGHRPHHIVARRSAGGGIAINTWTCENCPALLEIEADGP